MSADYWTWTQRQLKRVKTFFLTKDVLTFLVFLLISTAFWFMHALDRPRETRLNIPLVVQGVPNEVQILNELPEVLTVKVKDKGKHLFNYGRNKIAPIQLNLENEFKDEEGVVRIPKQVLQQRVVATLNATSDLLAFSPDTLALLYTRRNQKEVPVVMNALLQPMRQYQIRKVSLKPTTVTIYGTKQQLQHVDSVYTERSVVSDLKDSVEVRLALQQIAGVTMSSNVVTARVLAERFTEKRITVPVETLNFPATYNVKVFPAEVEVSFNVPLSEFAFVKPQDVRVLLDYHDVKSDKLYQEVQLQCELDYISNVKIKPMEVEFLLENKMEE